jgi:hypothetical protein
MIYFSDVDVVVKLAACGFLPWLPELLNVSGDEIQIQYLASLKTRVSRSSKKLENETHRDHLDAFCKAHGIIEAAADIDRQERLLQGGMDTGEAILFAEAEATGGIVVTGDKRALEAYARVSTPEDRVKLKVVCWEQLLLRVHHLKGYEVLKRGGCDGMKHDGLLHLAFSSGFVTSEDHAISAIRSYFNDVTNRHGDVLAGLEL